MAIAASAAITQPQVFINFRGKEVRKSFVSHLVKALKREGLNYYIDEDELRSEPIDILFERIDQSEVALAIFSKKYGDSNWCLDELGKIMKNVEQKKIRIIPIFFNVTPNDVKYQLGKFGMNLYQGDRYDLPEMTQWRKDLNSAGGKMGMWLATYKNESEFVDNIVAEVNKVIAKVSSESRGGSGGRTSVRSLNTSTVTKDNTEPSPTLYGMEQRLEQLDFGSRATQLVGIVGLAGIGKTALARMHFDKWQSMYVVKHMILDIRENSKTGDLSWLERRLLNGKSKDNADIFKKKSFLVLDDVSEKEQIKFLLDNLHRVKKGSKIVITTRDKSWIKQPPVQDIYIVPGLSDNDALRIFKYHAFGDRDYVLSEDLIKLSKKFVDYAGGNPRVLEELGNVLQADETLWGTKLDKLPLCCNEKIRTGFKISYDELTDQQKDVFLDIACFFRSEDEDYVTSLLGREVRDLADKFMISFSAGQVEMPDLLCSLGKELGLLPSVENNLGKSRLWDNEKAIGALVNKEGTECVRGIFLDVSKLSGIAIDRENLTKMSNLRYLKIFDSHCPRQCEADCKVNLPEKLDFPLQEIRYFHWLKFPLKRLPKDFDPVNLIDLRLPYSKIQCIWKGVKETPNLKWVDLSHSTELIDLSALSNAESLQRLSLEGCTMLDELPEEMGNMKSLAFLNLRGCTSLSSLPEDWNLISLRTLILSDCSNFNDFQVISENLEYLHLDGTTIGRLPLTIQRLQKLVVLNLKDCEMLDSLPVCLDQLKAIEELILSGCSRLRSFPEIKGNMESLQILLLDRTLLKEVPAVLSRCVNSTGQGNLQRSPRMSGFSVLRHLCLSRNDMISSLQSSISELYQLKLIDLKYCKNLISIPKLPPNLQCLDAHACTSLKTVASPLAHLTPTEQVHSSFIFTNCDKLEHVAKNEIICYGHNKARLLSETLNRHNKGLSFEALVATCFPGSEIPAWFSHKGNGGELEPELPRHWNESGFVGIALCAIVSFEEHTIQNNNLQVKCVCGFDNVKTSFSYFSFKIGGLSGTGDETYAIKSTHVFIGYSNWLNMKKCQEEDGKKKGCVPTKASVKYEVTDDTGVVTNCEVLKCGFSLVYESCSWDASLRKDGIEQANNMATNGCAITAGDKHKVGG